MPVSPATIEDIPAMVNLMNSAYRGEGSKRGWTTEADMIDGTLRTDETHLKELISLPGVVLLRYMNENNELEGCVFLQKREGKLYLGMLSVTPALQAKGIGKQLMAAAEELARKEKCPAVFMRVISIRDQLIAWYERQGYKKTGEIQPFENSKFGTARLPIEFVVMQKDL